MRENSGNCLISTSGLDDFRPQLSSSDKNRRRSRIDDSDSYTSELLASRLKDFRSNQSGFVGSRRKNRKNDNSDPISGVVALDLDWNRLCRDDQPRNSRLNRLANNDDDDDDFLAADNDISRPGARLSSQSKDRNDVLGPGSVLSNRSEERSADKQLFNLDDECTSEKSVRNNGRQSMKHPTIVHGEITR